MADKKDHTSYTLQDGYYKVAENWYQLLLVEGETAVMKLTIMGDLSAKVNYGDFGEADSEICEATGQTRYNLELSFSAEGQTVKELGVINEDGSKISTKSMLGGMGVLEKISVEEAKAMEDAGDPIDAPPSPYKIQPENQGRILWFTGPPGLGKSTTAQLLARNHGYVYYEADCFNGCKNPYVPVDVPDPSMAQMHQKQLVGEGLERRKEAIARFIKDYMSSNTEKDSELFKEYSELLCEDIAKEKARLGGDWAVAMVVMHRYMRDFIRSRLGPDLVFVVLEMSLEDQQERIRKRHKGDEAAVELLKKNVERFDPAGDDEDNAIAVKITADMSPEDVVKKTIEILNNNP